jgi:hypothetical protein
LSPPFFYYESTTQLITIVVPFIFLDSNNIAGIYFNEATLQYLLSFNMFFYGPNQPFGKDLKYIFVGGAQNYYPVKNGTSSSPQYYQYTQEYVSFYSWNSVRKVLLSSQTLPIYNEIVPSNSSNGTYSSYPIITDYVIPTEQAGAARSLAVYNPQGQYRLVSMSGNSPISSIDIKILWQDLLGNLYPIFIQQNQQADIKIGFFKKSLYNSSTIRKV